MAVHILKILSDRSLLRLLILSLRPSRKSIDTFGLLITDNRVYLEEKGGYDQTEQEKGIFIDLSLLQLTNLHIGDWSLVHVLLNTRHHLLIGSSIARVLQSLPMLLAGRSPTPKDICTRLHTIRRPG